MYDTGPQWKFRSCKTKLFVESLNQKWLKLKALAVLWAKFIYDQHFEKVVIALNCLNLVRKLMAKNFG